MRLACFLVRNQTLETKINMLIKGVTHESMDVREIALSNLRSLLHNNQEELHGLIVKGERVSPVVANLIDTVSVFVLPCL